LVRWDKSIHKDTIIALFFFIMYPMSFAGTMNLNCYRRLLPVSHWLIFLLAFAFFPPGQSAAQEADYHIGPRDVLTLTIYAGGENQQQVDLTVSPSGSINVPLLGNVKAAGMTLNRLEESIHIPLARDYFVDPQVTLIIKEYHSLRYYISGAVRNPGLYEMTARTTLMELIAKAGGVTAERGNVAYVLRGNEGQGADKGGHPTTNDPVKVDLQDLLDKGDMSRNFSLQTGDVVYIPLERSLDLGESKIYVEGEVNKPGVYAFQPGLNALNACIMAGGFTKYAAANRARIIRKQGEAQEIININLEDVKKGIIQDVKLEPGDLIHIPETWL
jgi:polysaccharide export outer membrane protein